MARVTIYGPHNTQGMSTEIELSNGEPRFSIVDHPFIVDVETLEQAFFAYGDWYRIEVDGEKRRSLFAPAPGRPSHDSWQEGEEPRYFVFELSAEFSTYVDAHVIRGEEEICPKQDVSFRLMDGDIVSIGMLVC